MITKHKRFRHETCKLRISLDGTAKSSSLTEEDMGKIDQLTVDLGVSRTHILSSLIKKALEDVAPVPVKQETTNEPETNTTGH